MFFRATLPSASIVQVGAGGAGSWPLAGEAAMATTVSAASARITRIAGHGVPSRTSRRNESKVRAYIRSEHPASGRAADVTMRPRTSHYTPRTPMQPLSAAAARRVVKASEIRCPVAKEGRLEVLPVRADHIQQIGQVRRVPEARLPITARAGLRDRILPTGVSEPREVRIGRVDGQAMLERQCGELRVRH